MENTIIFISFILIILLRYVIYPDIIIGTREKSHCVGSMNLHRLFLFDKRKMLPTGIKTYRKEKVISFQLPSI